MSELKIISIGKRPIKPIVEAALKNELRNLELAIKRTKNILKEFENKYNMSTEEFVRRYENDQLQETLELIDWLGEYRMLIRLKEKAKTLKEVRLEDVLEEIERLILNY